MGRLAFVVFLLLLEIVCRAHSASAGGPVMEGKANLTSGPASFSVSGSQVANASTCLNRRSEQGSCEGTIPAGITYATTVQNWSQAVVSGAQNLMGCPTGANCRPQTVTLSPCPTGIDYTSGAGYQVYIADHNPEAVKVTSGSGGTNSCSISFIPYFSHTAYTIGSASSGIQETVNVACGTSSATNANIQCNVIIPSNGPYIPSFANHAYNDYNIYGTIFLHSNQSVLDGSGVDLNCYGRGSCIQVGDLLNSNHYANNTIKGLSFRSPANYSTIPAYAGILIKTTDCNISNAGKCTITTSGAHGFRPGDIVSIQFTDNANYWGDAIVATVPTPTTFTFTNRRTIASQTTPGVVALAYEAILDNANGSHFIDLNFDVGGNYGQFNNFFDFWDDENAVIDHFNNNGIRLNGNVNWMPSFVYSQGGGNIGHTIAPVISLLNSNMTAAGASCITNTNTNGLYIENVVCQASGLWQIKVSNDTGNYTQSILVKNLYSESTIALNPLTPAKNPFPGLGIAGLIFGVSSSRTPTVLGENPSGAFATGGSGATSVVYFVVAHDTTSRTYSSPMQVLNWLSTGSDAPVVRWPRVANGTDTIVYDLIRSYMTSGASGAVYPGILNCTGGSASACGSITTSLSQAAACSGGFVCSYMDTGIASSTTSYTGHTPNYKGTLNFWPGTFVSVGGQIKVTQDADGLVNVGVGSAPLLIADICNGYVGSYAYTQCLGTINSSVSPSPNTTGNLVLDIGATGPTVSKGKLNFTTSPFVNGIYPHHIITLVDSQPGLSQATEGMRPLASANDVFIGTDVATAGTGLTSGQLAFGAPVAISNCIANICTNNTGWLERLTSKQKTFAVPVSIIEGNSFTLGDGSPLSQMKNYSAKNMPASRVPPRSCVDVVGEAKGLTKSDHITSINPPGRLGNLSLNAYPADEGAIILHFCNPSNSVVIAPTGAYSFLAVR